MKHIPLRLLIGEATLESGQTLVFPLQLPHVVRLNTTPEQLATEVYQVLHRQLLKKGFYQALLQYVAPEAAQYTHETLLLTLDASKDALFPETEIAFDFFSFQHENGNWVGIVPILSLSLTASDPDRLRQNMLENIRLEFVRLKRLASLPSVFSTQWFAAMQVHAVPLDFSFYTLAEQEREDDRQSPDILPHVARRMQAPAGELFGLDTEADRLLTALRSRNPVLVVADSGKGKTALIRDFVSRKHLYGLADTSVWEVSAARLLHRLSGFGSWEEYLAYLCNELRKKGDILYIQNFSELFEVGQYVGNSLSLADYLRDYIARGEILVLSECTPEQASLIELRSPGYLALFTQLKIEDLTDAQLRNIVWQRVKQLAQKKDCKIDEDAVLEILRLQQWYTPYSGLPGKTIHFSEALLADKQKNEQKHLRKPDIYKKFCQETGIPEFMLNPDLPLDFEGMTRFFEENIYGQSEAIHTVTDVLVAIKAALIRRGKPLASLLFAGPTGVGKTEMAKVLAGFMFGNRNRMIRFDMSEYADYQSLLRLTGDVYGGEGLLTSAVRQEPFSVLLFDELEKVHPAFYDLLLQILGEGRLTDAKGRVADFCSTLIIMTSNLGASTFQADPIGFTEATHSAADATRHFTAEVQAFFRPELFNRLDRIIAFAPLEASVIRQVVDREISLIHQREGLRGRNLSLQLESQVADLLGKTGYDRLYGARFLQRTLHEKLVIPLAESLNQFAFETPLDIQVSAEKNELRFRTKKRTDPSLAQQTLTDNPSLTVVDFTNAVTTQRRNTLTVNQGSYFAKFLSRLDQLERKLQKLKSKNREDAFWSDLRQQKTYYDLKETASDFATSLLEIQEIESENFLMLSGLTTDPTEQHRRFTSWQQAFNRLKEKLVAYENPEFMTCSLALYGKADLLFVLADRYLALAKHRDFKAKPFQLWHSPKWIDKLPGEDPLLIIRQEGDTYLRKPYTEPPDSHYLLAGIEIELSGNLPFLYFKEETGLHILPDSHATPFKYVVGVHTQGLKDNPTPPGIHRKNFFEGRKARRTYSQKGFKDETYNLQLTSPDHEKTLADLLDEHFGKNVDKYLF